MDIKLIAKPLMVKTQAKAACTEIDPGGLEALMRA
jgi:hypothetical protein